VRATAAEHACTIYSGRVKKQVMRDLKQNNQKSSNLRTGVADKLGYAHCMCRDPKCVVDSLVCWRAKKRRISSNLSQSQSKSRLHPASSRWQSRKSNWRNHTEMSSDILLVRSAGLADLNIKLEIIR